MTAAATALFTVSGCAGSCLGQPAEPAAASPQRGLAGVLAGAFPNLLIDNRIRDGALLADVVERLGGRRVLANRQHYDEPPRDPEGALHRPGDGWRGRLAA